MANGTYFFFMFLIGLLCGLPLGIAVAVFLGVTK